MMCRSLGSNAFVHAESQSMTLTISMFGVSRSTKEYERYVILSHISPVVTWRLVLKAKMERKKKLVTLLSHVKKGCGDKSY